MLESPHLFINFLAKVRRSAFHTIPPSLSPCFAVPATDPASVWTPPPPASASPLQPPRPAWSGAARPEAEQFPMIDCRRSQTIFTYLNINLSLVTTVYISLFISLTFVPQFLLNQSLQVRQKRAEVRHLRHRSLSFNLIY